MGSVCCVAVRDRSIASGPARDVLSRNIRHSPSWSFRWENRGRVAGEETSVDWISGGFGYNDKVDGNHVSGQDTSFASEERSPLDSNRSVRWQTSLVSQKISQPSKVLSSDPSDSRFHKEAEEAALSPTISHLSPPELSLSTPSVSSFSTSPLSSKCHALPTGSTPGHRLLRRVSDSRVPGFRSPTFSTSEEASSSFARPCWSNESTGGSNSGFSDSWSIPEFPTSHTEMWSFDRESCCFVHDISSGLSSSSISFDLQSCGICTKLLSEKSSFGCQKIISTNELTVAAVLPCAHVYHAECIESMTSEVNKYEPICPICTFSEKQALKMSEKLLKAEMDVRNRRRSRSRIVDDNLNNNVLVIERQKSNGPGGKDTKMSSKSSIKGSLVRPFLRRHFSLGSKGSSKSLSESSSRKKVPSGLNLVKHDFFILTSS